VFLVVGRSPVPAVRALGELPGVQVTGAVGDVRPFLARAWMFVAPLRIAQGVQNKVLEAIASNVPVVCSERVLAGIADGGFRGGRDVLSAATDEDMANAVVNLIGDAGLRERLADSARQRVQASYRWGTNLDRLEEMLGAVALPPAGSLPTGLLPAVLDPPVAGHPLPRSAEGAGGARRA
jgi:glycosyltransferase involved in cell wall biosynthesis